MDKRPVMQDLINENIVFEFDDVVENGWAIVPKTSGLEVGWHFPEAVRLWDAAGFVGPYEEMVIYAWLLTVKNGLDPTSFWTYCLAELGNSEDFLFAYWTPVAWNYKWELTEEVFDRFFNLRKWKPQNNRVYSNPLRRKWVEIGVGIERHFVTHEKPAASNIVAFVSSRPLPRPEIVKRQAERVKRWEDGLSEALEITA